MYECIFSYKELETLPNWHRLAKNIDTQELFPMCLLFCLIRIEKSRFITWAVVKSALFSSNVFTECIYYNIMPVMDFVV